MTQFSDKVKIRPISQLIKAISRGHRKLLKYFNGTAFYAFTVMVPSVLFENLYLNLNDSESCSVIIWFISPILPQTS